ncbi:MAG: hypothetical protein JXB45_08860 [Candidatus Krumholzibacteriota bacterium]|nr:hypothetical protein [Candidatus Krumholzibacteriota bacterium]
MNRRNSHKSICRGFLAGMLLLGIVCSFSGCGGEDGEKSPVNPGKTTIGPKGGTVTDSGGAAVTIPPGALSAETAITVETISSKGDLPADAPQFLKLLGGAEFGPTGTDFNSDVTITVPLDPPVGAGEMVSILVWNETEQQWEDEGGTVTVAPGGASATLTVDHFSLFSAVYNVFDNFDVNFGDGSTGQSAYDAYVPWFKANVTDMGRKGMYRNDCHEVVGLRIGVSYDVQYLPDGAHYYGIPYQMEGRTTDKDVIFYLAKDKSQDQVVDFNYALEVHVFLDCCAAEMVDVSAEPATINTNETSQVTATVMCDDEAMTGHQVTFEPQGGLGTVSPATATVSSGGKATTTFTAGDDEGTESVYASLENCQGQNTMDGAAQIEIKDNWTANMTITFIHDNNDEPLYQFKDVMNLHLNLDIETGVVSGTGTGTHSVALSIAGDCFENSMNAPSFPVEVGGAVVGDNLEFMVVPTDMLTVSFVLTCIFGQNQDDFPYPVYGWMESAMMGQDISVNVPWVNGGTDSGSGTDSTGGEPPMTYSYTVTLSAP